MSVRLSACNKSDPIWQIFMKFDMTIYENLSRKYNFLKNLSRITGTYSEDLYT